MNFLAATMASLALALSTFSVLSSDGGPDTQASTMQVMRVCSGCL